MKSILLEGPAGGGATELQAALCKEGYGIVVPQRPLPTCLAPAHLAALWAAPAGTVGRVAKHLHLSALQRGLCSTDVQLRAEQALQEAGVQVVLCLPPWASAVEAWLANEGKGFGEATNMYTDYKNEYKFYVDYWHGRTRSALLYDRTVYSAASFARALSELEYAA